MNGEAKAGEVTADMRDILRFADSGVLPDAVSRLLAQVRRLETQLRQMMTYNQALQAELDGRRKLGEPELIAPARAPDEPRTAAPEGLEDVREQVRYALVEAANAFQVAERAVQRSDLLERRLAALEHSVVALDRERGPARASEPLRSRRAPESRPARHYSHALEDRISALEAERELLDRRLAESYGALDRARGPDAP